MKLEITKEQCVAHAKAEGDAEVGAGILAANPMTDTPEPVASNAALIERKFTKAEIMEQVEIAKRACPTCHRIATRPDADLVRQLVEAAYTAGAEDVHDAWVEGTNSNEPDFAEAASDYARAAGYGGQS